MKYLELADGLLGEILPLYVISGRDAFLIQKAVSQFKKTCILSYEELNYSYFDDENFNSQTIINACNSLPFGNLKKLVVVKDPQKITSEDEHLFMSYAKNFNPSTCLVIISQEKFFYGLPGAVTVDCSALDSVNLQKLIAFQCKKQGKSITAEAGNLLIAKCDGDIMKITNEITKLTFYAKEDLITKEHVEETVTNSFNLDIYKLSNSLAEKNASDCLNILTNLLSAKVEPTLILSAISNSFRRMFLVQISTDKTNDELAKMLGVKPFAITKAKENAKKFSVKTLKKINELATQTDYMIKSGQMSAVNSIYYLIFNILIM